MYRFAAVLLCALIFVTAGCQQSGTTRRGGGGSDSGTATNGMAIDASKPISLNILSPMPGQVIEGNMVEVHFDLQNYLIIDLILL